MKLRCDFHIHSALSPCADPDMTPGNIVSMARLQDIQAIAITDHQSCGNCRPALEIASQTGDLIVLPGLEVESSEEVHLVCLFADIGSAEKFAALVWGSLPSISNRPDIFGEQLYFDSQDQVIGHESRLLLQACGISCDELAREALNLGGVCLPAHVDREANGMLSILGHIPPDFPASFLEVSAMADENSLLKRFPELRAFRMIRGSDAHRLEDLAMAGWAIDLKVKNSQKLTAALIIEALRAGLT